MNKKPKVSILMTVYNREKYVQASIESALTSNFTNFELIIVDDKSSDQSRDIIRSFRDSRIHFVENEKNLGDYGNRMKAASLAAGKYLKYLDSDDLLYPYSLDIMVDAMERFQDCALGLCHSLPEDVQPYPWKLTPPETYEKHFIGRGCIACGPSAAIISREVFLESGGFDKTWGVLSDTELWLRLAAKHPIVLMQPGLVWWRRHESQEFNKNQAREVYMELGYKLDLKAIQGESCPLHANLRNHALRRIKQHHSRRILSLAFRERRIQLALKLLKSSGLTFANLATGLQKYN